MNIPISKKPALFIVDGSYYIFRAYHAIPPLTNKDGIPTNAVYGYTTMLMKTIEQYKPDYFVIVFDSKGPTFREKIDTEYKANRGAPPDDLSVQFPYIFEITDAMLIKQLFSEGYEADDVIATLTDKAKNAGFGVVIVGADKDLMSVIDDDTVMLDTRKDQWITSKDVVEKFGVKPSQISEFLMLTGDSIDNIKGVPGVGKKTAMELLVKYGSIDGIYEHIKEIANQRIKASLINAKEHLYEVSKPLVQLKHDVPVDVDIETFRLPSSGMNSATAGQRERLMKLFSKFEFKRLIENLGKVDIQFNYTTVNSLKSIENILKSAPEISVLSAGSEMGIYADKAYYLNNTCIDDIKDIMKLNGEVIVHDAKAIHRLCIEHNIDINAKLFAVELAAYLCNPEAKSYSLKSLALSEFGEELPELSQKTDSGSNGDMFYKQETKAVYVAKGAMLLKRLSEVYKQRLKHDAIEPLFSKIEMPLSSILAKMEHTGICVDYLYLKELSNKFNTQLNNLLSGMHSYISHSFNPDSPKQVADILFSEFKLSPVKKTKTGYSTDNDVLNELKDRHPFVTYLLEYRNLSKLKNSFIDTLPTYINPKTGRIHTHFIQTGTATGRLSSSEPNLQNIPVKSESGKMIRKAFTAGKGYSLLSADYSQIELRIMAHLSSDETLIDAFMHDQDIHTITASGVFRTPVNDVTPQMRNRAKVINFGIMYGMSAYGLSKQLGIPPEEAHTLIEAYFEKYKGVNDYIQDILNGVKQTGYVGTLLGRRRFIPKTLDNPAYRRIAINTPVQGSAADLIKIAMLRVDDIIEKRGFDAKMLLQIHDELIFEVKDEQIKSISNALRQEMEGAMKLLVPLKVTIIAGKTWADTKE